MSDNKKSFVVWASGLVALVSFMMVPVWVFGQMKTSTHNKNEPKEVTLQGKIVDLQSFMTDEWLSADHAKCTADCIRSGVPAALQTDNGLYILGTGMRSPAEKLMPFAFQTAEVTGRLYEKNNVRYLDFTAIKAGEKTTEKTAPIGSHSWEEGE